MEYYDIIVKGHLGDKRLGYFDGFDATLLPTGETLLVGPVTDQAALHGVLRRIGELRSTPNAGEGQEPRGGVIELTGVMAWLLPYASATLEESISSIRHLCVKRRL